MNGTPKIIWDLPTRITHWALASCVILNLFVIEEGDDWHRWLGYAAAALVGFRFLWGFWGAEASRLRALPISPGTVIRFFRSGLNGEKYSGHNPLASLVYIAIWLIVLGLGTTGHMMEEIDAFWGEAWVEDLHENLSLALQVLLGLHLVGVFADSLRYRRHTWRSMITGKK